jgi:hypothetical protein
MGRSGGSLGSRLQGRGRGRRMATYLAGKRKWGSVSFSPNGSRITASSAAGVAGEPQLPDVYTVRVDGRGRRDVTRSPEHLGKCTRLGISGEDR